MRIGHVDWAASVGVLLVPFVVTATASAQTSHEAAVRVARGQSNRAIAAHDLAGIARHWMADVHIVTSTGAVGSGREANADRMATQFARRPDTVYVRTPINVDVFDAWGVAAERGEWTGRWTEPDGVVVITGTYLAKWRQVDAIWRIQTEVFVPTACRGSSYCASHP